MSDKKLDVSKFDETAFNDNLVVWQDIADEAVGHEKSLAIFYLPEPIERFGNTFNAMCLVKLKDGKRASVYTRFDENGRPLFGVDKFVMSNFIKE